jgi:hypothetical protein
MRARRAVATIACSVLPLLAVRPAAADTTVHADLVPQNHSGVRGTVSLTATDEGDLHVQIRAHGLIPGPHAQHLHGAMGGGQFRCASMSDDTNGDGWLSNEEASGEYGNIFLALTTRGDVSAQSGLDLDRMPVADADGRLTYDRTIPAAQLPNGLLDELSNLHLVQHGIDANGNGKYDVDALGESTFAASLGLDGVPEEATDPAACGVVVGAGLAETPRGGVETGSSPGGTGVAWLGLGGLLLVLAGTLSAARRRRAASPDPE